MAKLPKKLKDSPLTDQEEIFVINVVHYGMTQRQAARNAGIHIHINHLMADPRIQRALKEQQEIIERRAQVDRGMIVRGLRDAVDQANMLGDPGAQVAGWREIAKVTDNYEPKRDLPLTGRHRQVLDRLSTLSEDDLLRLMEKPVNGATITVGAGKEPVEDQRPGQTEASENG